MSETFENVLLDKLNELKIEISSLQERIQELFKEIGVKQEQAQHIIFLLAAEGYNLENEDLVALGTIQIADIAFEFLDKTIEKNPLHYKEIANSLFEKGIFIPGKDPYANLLSHISRDHRFVRVAPGTYGLEKWGLKPAKPTRRKRKR